MKPTKTSFGRREFLKSTAVAGGGMMIGFSWLAGAEPARATTAALPDEWFDINAYLTIAGNGTVSIRSPNPEFGQNVMTSMPMIVADELDVDWQDVVVEQAPFNADLYERQFSGGSQGIRQGWQGLRMAGAAARQMLREAAAETWQVPVAEITTGNGELHHEASGNSAGYGEMASAAASLPVPQQVQLKAVSDFGIIGTSQKNVEGPKIVSGKPLFVGDFKRDGMLVAMVVHAPAFGMKLKSVDDSAARAMPGIRHIFPIKTLEDDYARNNFDTDAFPDLVAVVGDTTWQVMNARKALEIEWEPFADHDQLWAGADAVQKRFVPAGLESSDDHRAQMADMAVRPANLLRRDGDPEAAFERAAKVIERTYSAPFLAHNPMEPITCFADVRKNKVEVAGPVQGPVVIEKTLSARLGIPIENIDIRLSRMGGGFGRRAYSHYLVEAALISQRAKAPVKLQYSREDDMTFGVYRPAYRATYRAALDADNQLIAYHVKAGGIPGSPLGRHANRFPAGAVDNYLAEDWDIESNITTGAFRAPGSNFLAGVEQSFLDEVAEAAGQDPIQFRLDLLHRAKSNPVGENNDYAADRYAGVLELVRDKSGWSDEKPDVHRGVSAYFCHNTYVAQVLDIVLDDGKPVVQNVSCAVDCGIVVNPDAAANMAEGAIIDGIGNALFGELPFKDGVPQRNNFHSYRMIRMSEAPQAIDVHFVKSDVDPTGMGEPPFPPIFGAVANALYRATGRRYYDQPFLGDRRST